MAPETDRAHSPLLGILSAFRSEVSSLRVGLDSPQELSLGRRRAWRGSLGRTDILICAGGMGPEKATAAAQALLQQGVSALFCIGAAGALDDGLEVGDLVIAEWVLAAEASQGHIPCHEGWIERARMLAGGRGARLASGGVVSVSRPVTSPQDKARLARETNALAVDMESAAAAQAADVPFVALRVITDDARTALPDFRRGWRHPGRFLAEGAGFLARAGSMRRALNRLQDFVHLLVRENPLQGYPSGKAADSPDHTLRR